MPFKLKSAVVAATTVLAALLIAAPALAASPTPLGSMPDGTVTFHRTSGRGLAIALDAFGLTPGSAHEVALSKAQCGAATGGSGVHVVEADGSGQLHAGFRVGRRQSRGADSVLLLLGTGERPAAASAQTRSSGARIFPSRCAASRGSR